MKTQYAIHIQINKEEKTEVGDRFTALRHARLGAVNSQELAEEIVAEIDDYFQTFKELAWAGLKNKEPEE